MAKVSKAKIDREEIIQSDVFKVNQEFFIKKAQRRLINKYYFKNQFKKDILFILLSAFLTVIAFDYFISSTGQQGIYPGGLGSISKFLAIIVAPGNDSHAIQMQSTYYYVWYVGLNIPFMLFGFWKLGFRFSFTTTTYMIIQIAFDQILQAIPVINPQEFHMIMNFPLLNSLTTQWNSVIWLFIFAIIGGALLGYAYSWVYKAESSTGGTDFLTMYFSIKKNQNVGTVNRNANFLILGLVIIINTILMTPDDITSAVKMSVLSNGNEKDIEHMLNFLKTNNGNIHHGELIWENDFWTQYENDLWYFNKSVTSREINEEVLRNFVDNKKEFHRSFMVLISNLANEHEYVYSSKMIGLMKFEYIFGPSLFSSILFIITQSLVINAFYPKYKVRTYVITTLNADGIEKTLIDNGYKNNIIVADTKITSADEEIDSNKKVIMISMTVVNWRNMKKFLYEVDPKITVNVLRTKRVEGKFDYEIRNDHMQQHYFNEIINDKKMMKKIDRLAFDKTKKDINEAKPK